MGSSHRLLLIFCAVVLLLTGGPASFGWSKPASAQDAALPSVDCGASQLTVEMGQKASVPLASRYSNPTSARVTVTAYATSNLFWEGDPDLGTVATLPPNTGRVSSGARVFPLQTDATMTPLGTSGIGVHYRLEMQAPFRATKAVYQHCFYRITVLPPENMKDLIQIPVRWCAIEGSYEARGQQPGSLVDAKTLFGYTKEANDKSWIKHAHIAFMPVVLKGIFGGQARVPVSEDPYPDGTLGELDGGDSLDSVQAVAACHSQWQSRAPGKPGIVAVNVADFTGATVGGSAPMYDRGLMVQSRVPGTGTRGNDLCGEPRHLTVSDVADAPFDSYPSRLWVTIEDQRTNPGYQQFAHSLAHELGHVLFLGHGNGLDDDRDGTEPPTDGPRRYDEYCDDDWLVPPLNEEVAEDRLTTGVSNLMTRSGTSFSLTPLQVETARATAKLIPGAKIGPAT